jgi:cardiolipin synthase
MPATKGEERARLDREHTNNKRPRRYRWVAILATIALILQSGMLFLALFEPGLRYFVVKPYADNTSEEFLRTLEALTGAHLHRRNSVEVLTNGENYYPAELAAIRGAQASVNIECYIFEQGDVGRRFLDALTERARAGVKVNLLLDALGSAAYSKKDAQKLIDAGGRVEFYHPLRWYTWPRINYRTHRELYIIDGKAAFLGGAGVGDHWVHGKDGEVRWRDTMVKVQGDVVSGIQGTFAENWLEAAGEILTGKEYFPFAGGQGNTVTMIVGSAPTSGRSTPARVLFQTLISSAKEKIYITSPYFLPDRSLRDELGRAVKERGIDVRIVVPGKKIDHTLTRRSSRRLFGDLLLSGVKIYEYQPSMIHTKSLVIDGIWSVVGSTNMDSRSFGINDEVNLAALDPALAARLEQDFRTDLGQSRMITYEQWRNRPFWERVHEWFGALLERQQ